MRKLCVSCDRPEPVCLCAVLPEQSLETITKVIILQHPHETRHKLATVPIVARCLSSCEVVVGRRIKAGTCSLLDSCSRVSFISPTGGHEVEEASCRMCGHKRAVLLLFPSPTATDLKTWYRSSNNLICRSSLNSVRPVRDGKLDTHENTDAVVAQGFKNLTLSSAGSNTDMTVSGEARDGRGLKSGLGHVILIIVDGTWQHAKEMVKASMPFLGDFVVQVSLPHDISREGWGMGDSESILRKEPFAGCVSTMEAVARSLAVLEPNGSQVEGALLSVLHQMVNLQASHFSPLKPRPRLATKRERKGVGAPT